MSFHVREIRKGDLGDAERLAAMFSTWDSVWPGGFTRGVALTPQWVMQETERRRSLCALVAEEAGAFLGFCDVQAQASQKDVAYVGLLGASPEHHGKGVGKRLLLETVRRVTADGYYQLTLHTWAGNMKAVPLYKKTGFHWEPDTSVYMRNFLPAILSMPAGKKFFANRDWYACQERDLKVAPDEIAWKGMKVYPYRFRDGQETLSCIFDSASERLTALETPDYSVSCSIPTEEGAAGETYPIVWEFAPKGGKPLEVTLLAEPEPGLEIQVQERFLVEQDMTVTRSVRVSPDARPRHEGESAHRVRSLLLIDGMPISLETGIKVVPPIEIDYAGGRLLCGREEKITVRLRSRLDREVTGVLSLDSLTHGTCLPQSQMFTLPARSWTECPLRLTPTVSGIYPATLRCTAENLQVNREIVFRAFADSTPLANMETKDNERGILESPALSVVVGLYGGRLRLTPAGMTESPIGQPIGEVGPPFSEYRQRPLRYDVRAEQFPCASLVLTAPSEDFPGLTVERAVSLLADSVARVDYRVLNTTEKPQTAKLKVRNGLFLQGHLVYPSQAGVIREPMLGWGGFPESDHDVLAQGDTLAESWFCQEEENKVCGVVWQEGPETELGRGMQMVFDLGEIPAYSQKTLDPLYLIAGYGGWETVRGWWQRLIQSTEEEEQDTPVTHRVLAIDTEPSHALLQAEENSLHLVIRNERESPLNGTLELSGEPFLAQPLELPIANLDRDNPFTAEVKVSLPETPSSALLQARIDCVPMPCQLFLPVVYLGGQGAVEITEQADGQIVIDNGYLVLRAAPTFAGSLTALERNGVNHLFSGFPESRPFNFTNPWFGGVHAFFNWPGDVRLTRETYTGSPTERTGERGWKWQGVLTTCDLQHKDLQWLRLEMEYLTLPGSNVVAIVTRWINKSGASQSPWGGVTAWCQAGGTREHATAHWEWSGEKYRRVRGGFAMSARSGSTAAVENSETGDVLAMVAAGPSRHIHVDDFGKEGAHLTAVGPLKIKPNSVLQTLHWLILTNSVASLEGYAALAKSVQLP